MAAASKTAEAARQNGGTIGADQTLDEAKKIAAETKVIAPTPAPSASSVGTTLIPRKLKK